jgi:hypothetical protein
MHVEVIIASAFSIFGAEHRVPKASGEQRLTKGTWVEAFEGIKEVDVSLWTNADLERLHLDSYILSVLILEGLIPLGSKLVERTIHNVDIVVQKFQFLISNTWFVNATTLMQVFMKFLAIWG